MQREFLQEKTLNRLMDNAEKSVNVDLSAKSKLIPYSTSAGMLSLSNLYKEERDACENYRMIFTVNPVCTNILYNAVTEPVYLEGSYSAVCLVDSTIETPLVLRDNEDIFPNGMFNTSGNSKNSKLIDQIFAVRDTEISHEKIGNFKYHCGYDIFNNHLLRTDDFNHVSLEGNGTGNAKNEVEFNTIFDFAIDYSGKTVMRVIDESAGPVKTIKRVPVRMYQLDTIKSINTAFYDNLRTVDGWYGFYNSGYINIPNGKLKDKEGNKFEVSVNHILNNETPCGFIDLYPDRTLYSFIPKVNRFKRRLERNWDCAIVYPFKSDYDTFNRVMLNFSGTSDEWEIWKNNNQKKIPNSVKVLNQKIVYDNVGDVLIEMHSLLRHTLVPGDSIRLFYAKVNPETGDFSEIIRYSVPVRVIGVGDTNGNDTDKYFTIKLYDVSSFCGILESKTDEQGNTFPEKIGYIETDKEVKPEIMFFYRKIENGYDNKYYFRKFKEIKNYEYVQSNKEIPGAVKVTKNIVSVTEDSLPAIQIGNDYFYKVERPLTYTQNKIAYAGNIYGDRVAQVIFNDDICVSGLKDNLGRPLSSVYFMVEKTNRGHVEWYEDGIFSADTVEFSHCFGDVTSGLDLPKDSGSTDFNVRKLHNVFSGMCDSSYSAGLELILEEAPSGNYIDGTPLPLESGITLDTFSEFYGDIVEFSKANFKETVIEKVYHRFNTTQRECLVNKNYYNINYDELVGDLFDVTNNG